MTATATKSTIRPWSSVLVILLVLGGLVAVMVAGCSGTTTTTTTTLETTTSTSLETTTTTEEITTTTTTAPVFPPLISHEQDDTRFIYSGTWSTVSASKASGGSLALGDSFGCSVTIHFYGDAISWVAKTSPAYGQAKVTVDKGSAQTVDLYSASTVWAKKVWKSGTLDLGDHTVTIAWSGKKNSASTGTNLNIDAIVVSGVLTATYQEDSSSLKFTGTWKSVKSSSAAEGAYLQADASGAEVSMTFTGTRLVWVARTAPSCGQATVSVDDAPGATVDLYSSSAKAQVAVWDSGVLPLQAHTVTITWLGAKDTNSTGTAIDLDAVTVTGSLK